MYRLTLSSRLFLIVLCGMTTISVAEAGFVDDTIVVEEAPIVDFGAESLFPGCSEGTRTGTGRALLVGNNEFPDPIMSLIGSENSAQIMRSALDALGVMTEVLVDGTSSEIIEAFRKLVQDSECGDTVFIHLAGHSIAGYSEAGSLGEHNDTGIERHGPSSRAVYLTPDFQRSDSVPPLSDLGIRDVELASVAVALRNKGAFVVFALDLDYAGAYDLFGNISRNANWEISSAVVACDSELDTCAPEESSADNRPRLNRLAAGMAVFYGAGEGRHGMSSELRLPLGDPNRIPYGLFSYTLAQAILTLGPEATLRELAIDVIRQYDVLYRRDRTIVSLETTDPVRSLTSKESRDAASALQQELAVEIISPKLTRGLDIVVEESFELEGRVDGAARVIQLIVNGEAVAVQSNGYFRTNVSLTPSQSGLQIFGFLQDSTGRTWAAETEISVSLIDTAANLSSAGRQLALLIGNQNYSADSGYSNLRTPHEDVDAIGDLLRNEYGFQTTIRVGGVDHNLVLKDASRAETTDILNLLERNLSIDDSLLVFYAGHGVFVPEINKAFWVPSDASAGSRGDLIRADEITEHLTMTNANHILVVSDSCYSGALSRGDPGPLVGSPENSENRNRYLQALFDRRSRSLLSSGSNEPVWDGGGGTNHSVFAAALIRGLEERKDETFSAEELYAEYLKESVAGSSEQVPQYQFLQNSGHKGGGFLFFGERRE